ncbi:MAG: hypothetical protein AAF673_03870, partial [Pseudomonadota bacterium]
KERSDCGNLDLSTIAIFIYGKAWINYVITATSRCLSLALAMTMILRIRAVIASIFFLPLAMSFS